MGSRCAIGDTVMSETLSGIRIDIGSGAATRPGWVGLDNRGHPAVTHVWDLEQMPWPLDDGCAIEAFAGFVVARINPARFGFIRFMNEVWRVLQPGGALQLVTYYGVNQRFAGDPAACNPCTEVALYHFDPEHRAGLWLRYQPAPWRVCDVRWEVDGNLEALLVKRG